MSALIRVFASLIAVSGSMAIAQPSRELIFPVGSAPFAASHASTIVQLRNGELLAAWFGGTGEGHPDVAIWSARRTASGWSAPIELAREPHVPCWNPVLFHSGDGRLWLYYRYGPAPFNWVAARRFSLDEGRTWSPAEHLPAGLLGPIRTKPLLLDNGVIVSGTSIEAYHSWSIWIERSTDNGATLPTHRPSSKGTDSFNPPSCASGKNACVFLQGPLKTLHASASLIRLTTASPGLLRGHSTCRILTPASMPSHCATAGSSSSTMTQLPRAGR